MRAISRAVVTTAAAMALGVLPHTAPASADPEPPITPVVTTVPERPAPEGTTPFTDDPSITDARLHTIEGWSRLPDDHALTIYFTSGDPACYGAHTEVEETSDIVAVKLWSGAVPAEYSQICTMIAVTGALTVNLQAPVGNRAVVSIT